MEYLLLIGGAVLVSTIILVLVLTQVFPASEGIVNSNINEYTSAITLNAAFGGGGPPACDNDNTQEGSEQCDGTDLAGQTCVSQGFTEGTLSCSGTCTFDTSLCTGPPAQFCGNNTQEGTEVCDGTDMAGETCLSQGFTGGTLACASDCLSFDMSSCTFSTFANFAPTGAPVLNTGFATYNFTWDSPTGVCPVGTVESGIMLGADTLYPTGSEVILKTQLIAFGLLVASSTASFDPASGAENADATHNALKLISNGGGLFPGEANPSFGVVCDSGTSNFTLHSAKVTSTYLQDLDSPVAPAAPGVSTGSLNGGVINLTATTTSDKYLGIALTDPLIDHTDVSLACGQNLMDTSALVDAAISAGKSISFANQSSGTALAPPLSVLNYSNNLLPSQNYRCAVRACDIVDGKTVIGTPNCSYSLASVPVVSSKEAELWEAESGVPGASILSPVQQYQGEDVAQINTVGCLATNVNETYTVNLKAPTSPNVNYTVWVRGANVLAVAGFREYFKVTIGGANKIMNFTSILAGDAPLAWIKATTVLSSPGLTQTARLDFTDNAGVSSCTGTAELRIDKILITTDAACTPVGTGANCQ
jgi:hypothetical protein